MDRQKQRNKAWSVVLNLLQLDRKWKVRACVLAMLLGLNIGSFLQPYVLGGFHSVEAIPANISASDLPAAQAIPTPPRTPLESLQLATPGENR